MTTTSADGAGAARPTLRIDLAAIRANWRHFASLGPAGATIKADAYGLGADRVGPALLAEGCYDFFVAQPQEGAALRAALGAGPRITVYNGPTPDALHLFREHDLRPVLNAPHQIALWRKAGSAAPCALHIDTGMNRLGLTSEETRVYAGSTSGVNVTLLMSHLACADDPSHPMNAAQLVRFAKLAALFPGVPRSLANSGGALIGADFQLELTRPGIGLYGGQPQRASHPALRPVATIAAPVLATRRIAAGETVGYGAAFTAPSDMTIAIVALGYADGLIRAASPGASGVLDGVRVPLVGRISMDLAAVDITGLVGKPSTVFSVSPANTVDIDNTVPRAEPGACIEFLGRGLETFAAAAGTISYEVLTGLGARYERVYAE